MRARLVDPDRPTDPRPTILVVDPDPVVGEGLVLALRQQARVEWVASGLAGLLIAVERAVELVITEEDLPDVVVDDLLRLLRLLRPGVSVALLGARLPSRTTGRQEPDAQFPKPFDLRLLLAWIVDCLAHASTDRSLPVGPLHFEEGTEQHLDIIRWTIEIVERCQHDGMFLTDFARATGVSVWRLCRAFKRVTGLSLKRYLARTPHRGGAGVLIAPGVTTALLAWTGGAGGKRTPQEDRAVRRRGRSLPTADQRFHLCQF